MGDTLHARNTDPLASRLSALQAESPRGENEAKVLEILKTVDGLTARELSEVLEIEYVTVSPLLRPMARRGLIHLDRAILNSDPSAESAWD